MSAKGTTDAVEILHRRYIGNEPGRLASLGWERRLARYLQRVNRHVLPKKQRRR